MVDLLAPFEQITKQFCGAKYPTLNLVYPYIELLKKRFAPKLSENETMSTYLDLIYEEFDENYDENSETSSVDNDNDISTAGTRKQWQYAHK